MASFAKAQKAARREHRERDQPHERQKLGLLEKGKDWKKRRDDFHFKEKRIKSLQEKARNRNPDEFYFGMVNSKTKDGVHEQKRAAPNVYTAEEIKLMKTQDMGYVNMKMAHERNKLEQLKTGLHLLLSGDCALPAGLQGQHTVFVDTAEEVANFDPAVHFDTAPALVDRAFNRPRLAALTQTAMAPGPGVSLKGLRKQRAARDRELDQRLAREAQLGRVAGALQLQRNLMGTGRRSKVTTEASATDGPAVYRWRKERKK